jgi:selenocysteine lyase/cysteine desulfurase
MCGRKELLENLSPYKVDPASNRPPQKWEMGTRDQALFASIAAVIDYLCWLGGEVQNEVSNRIGKYQGRIRLLKAALSWIEEYEQKLSTAMLRGTSNAPGLSTMTGVEIYGLKDTSRVYLRSPTFSFNIRGADPKKVADYMWAKHSVVIYPDDFYSRALKTFGISLAIRASLVHYNTVQEIEQFLLGLADTLKHFDPN